MTTKRFPHCVLVAGLLALTSCATVAPAVDFPEIPLPEKAEIGKIPYERVDGGVLIRDESVEAMIRDVKLLEAERDRLREIIEFYNSWAAERWEEGD